ncbi:hypothetical protein HPB48_020411 [Haemaphysalis longicornis]|uniref:Uncharacterized protein n=1 Tax=Haemaphysalis longicornis TaxID=44386 RepID=A0A9J6GRK1_HAELO|nr:hypothetical protein HPB48_020411 [Haemaphysalis longicornis]
MQSSRNINDITKEKAEPEASGSASGCVSMKPAFRKQVRTQMAVTCYQSAFTFSTAENSETRTGKLADGRLTAMTKRSTTRRLYDAVKARNIPKESSCTFEVEGKAGSLQSGKFARGAERSVINHEQHGSALTLHVMVELAQPLRE